MDFIGPNDHEHPNTDRSHPMQPKSNLILYYPNPLPPVVGRGGDEVGAGSNRGTASRLASSSNSIEQEAL